MKSEISVVEPKEESKSVVDKALTSKPKSRVRYADLKKRPAAREIPGFRTYRATIDDPLKAGRKEEFLERGYTPVYRRESLGPDCDRPDELDIKPVGSADGHIIHGLLMKIPTEWYEEDQAAKVQANKALQESLTPGRPVDSRTLLHGSM